MPRRTGEQHWKGIPEDAYDPVVSSGGPLVHWMEELMETARQRGDFDDLPGKGKPLQLEEYDPYAGPDAQAYAILSKAGFKPEWVELRVQIVDRINALRNNPDHPDRLKEITEVNAQIGLHNRLIPVPSLAFPKLDHRF